MINDNSDEIEFILWDEQDDENNSSWIYGRIRFDKRLWFFPEVLSFSPSSNYRHPRRQSNLRFFDRQQSNYNFPYKSLETKREIAGLENLPWLEHLPAEIMDYCQDSINLLIGSYYFSNFWEVLADNETKTFPVKVAKYFLSPISVASNLTRYVVLENGNTTRIGRAKEVGKELGVIFFASLVIGPMYREDSPYLEGIKQLENFLVTTWPESVAAISESQIKVESLIFDGECPVPKEKESKKSTNTDDGSISKTKEKQSVEECELDENVKEKKIEIVYRIKKNPALVREAERMGKDQAAQKNVNHLIEQLSLGNGSPGIGTVRIKGLKNVSESRGRNEGRVYFRKKDEKIEILGKSNKDNQKTVIAIFKKMGY